MDKKYIATWYEDDAIDDDGFHSDIFHSGNCPNLEMAKLVSMKNAEKHGAMVCAEVIEQKRGQYGFETIHTHTCEYFDNKWQDWTTRIE